MTRARAALLVPMGAAALACVAQAPAPPAPARDAPPARDADAPAAIRPGPDDGYLAPNARDVDGTAAYVHYERADMPLRVAVELPKLSALNASREQTEAAVIEAIRLWERALQPSLPWFALEIVRGGDDADIVVEWKTRISNGMAGYGGIRWQAADRKLRVRGSFEYATQPCLHPRCRLELAELQRVVAHEFGHTLGLGHCLDCDSAMNYSWETRERILVTDTDVRTLVALYAIPNGTRVDGTLLIPLRAR